MTLGSKVGEWRGGRVTLAVFFARVFVTFGVLWTFDDKGSV